MVSAPPSVRSLPVTHPFHVILSAYPIACFTGAFLTDLAYAKTYEMQWANFSVWLITAGLVMGVLSGVAGVLDLLFQRNSRGRRTGRLHSLGSALVMVIALLNAFIHSRDAYTSVMPAGLVLSAITALLVLVMSWVGTVQAMEVAR